MIERKRQDKRWTEMSSVMIAPARLRTRRDKKAVTTQWYGMGCEHFIGMIVIALYLLI
jgi:hypothetical protein